MLTSIPAVGLTPGKRPVSLNQHNRVVAFTPRFGHDNEAPPRNRVVDFGLTMVLMAATLLGINKLMTGSYTGLDIPKAEDMFNPPPAKNAPEVPAKPAPKAAPNAVVQKAVQPQAAPPKVILGPNIIPIEDEK